jgi:glucose/arabinose dehydrogenase
MKRWLVFFVKSLMAVVILLPIATAGNSAGRSTDIPLEFVKLPPGFKINIYASDIPNARSMALSPQGTLFVGTRKAGKVYAVLDPNGDFRADESVILVKGLNMPNGVAFRNGSLYVAEVNRILRYDDIEKQIYFPPKPVIVNNSFPRDKHHGWKYIAIGPDEMLYVPVGAPCNICKKEDPRYSTIMRLKLIR